MILLPALLAAALLLAASGLAKLRDPRPAAAALGLSTPLVRIAALVELAAGVACIVASQAAVLAGALYAVFAVVVAAQLARGSTASCGCLGRADTPPSTLHLVLNVLLASTAFAAGALRPANVVSLHPAAALVVALAAVTGAFLLATAASLVPPALGAYRRPA